MKDWLITVFIGMVLIVFFDLVLVATNQDIPGWYHVVMAFAVFGLAGALLKKFRSRR